MEEYKVVIVETADVEEVNAFHSWIVRNRQHVLAISENEGCGCCVDIWYIKVDGHQEQMPHASEARPGDDWKAKLQDGERCSAILDEITQE